MPKEKFYPRTAIEGEPSDHFEITWHGDNPAVIFIAEIDGIGTAWELDRSGINRLIKTLRRARDATYGADE